MYRESLLVIVHGEQHHSYTTYPSLPRTVQYILVSERGSEVSLRCLSQDQLVQAQVRHCFSQAFVFLLEPLKFLQLVYAQTSVLFLPAVVDLFGDLDFSNRIEPSGTLPKQYLNLTQFLDDFFRFVLFDTLSVPPYYSS